MLVALDGVAVPARAQRVTGVVRDSASREPVPSAVVRLFDASGRELERTITGRDGRYRLDALPAADTSYGSCVSDFGRAYPVPRAPPHATRRSTSCSLALPTLLEAVKVDDQPRCSRRLGPLRGVRAVGTSARGAPGNGRRARVPRADDHGHHLRSHRGSSRPHLRQKVRRDSLPTNRPFIAARHVGEFRDDGYADGVAGPAHVLRARRRRAARPAFGDGHCFSLREDREQATQDRSASRSNPLRDRAGVVDIAGAMWLDAALPALRTLEFRYTNVERAIADAQTGGFVSFRTATNGFSVIDRWNLHLPSIETSSRLARRRSKVRPAESACSTLPSSDDAASVGA